MANRSSSRFRVGGPSEKAAGRGVEECPTGNGWGGRSQWCGGRFRRQEATAMAVTRIERGSHLDLRYAEL